MQHVGLASSFLSVCPSVVCLSVVVHDLSFTVLRIKRLIVCYIDTLYMLENRTIRFQLFQLYLTVLLHYQCVFFSLILYSALATAIAVSRHYNHSLV